MNPHNGHAVAIHSGGMDSSVMVKDLLDQGYKVDTVSFDYGQRHSKELKFARAQAEELGLRHDIIDLSGLTNLLAESGSSLVSHTDVPEGHYAEENMKATVVPNRNMIMLSIAAGIAVSRSASVIATGVHSGDHFIYPDCRPAFIRCADDAVYYGNEGFGNKEGTHIMAPFQYYTKADIAKRGILLGVDFSKTWSCYKGGEKHCGKCGTCVERLEAIHQGLMEVYDAGYPQAIDMDDEVPEGTMKRIRPYKEIDTTEYEDEDFWVEAVKKASV